MRCPGRKFTNRLFFGVFLLSVALCSGCVSGNWSRQSRYAPPAAAAFEALDPGVHTLTSCLAELGAPLWAWESPEGQSALAWGWLETEDLGFRVSVPVTESASGTFTFNNIDQDMQGLVLFFDDDWKLVATRRGLLRDLTQFDERTRPTLVDNTES